MYIQGADNQLPRLWKASENMLRPLGARRPYVITLDSELPLIHNISKADNTEKLSKMAKFLHLLFFLTVIPPLFLLIARTAYRHHYNVDENLKDLNENVSHAATPVLNPSGESSAAAEKALFTRIETYTILDNAASQYVKLIPHRRWQKPQAQNFLYFELQRILNELHNLEIAAAGDLTLKPMIKALKESVMQEMGKLKVGDEASLLKPEGIRNVGNSCYMNAALQPLLALSDIRKILPKKLNLFPGETRTDLKKRQMILDAFTQLVELHQNNAKAKELGAQVAKLRKRIFQAALEQGNFTDPAKEKAMADSGEFFDLLIYIVGWSVREKITSIAIDGNEADMPYKKVSTHYKPVHFLGKKGSVQEAINAYCAPSISDADGWTVDIPEFGKGIPVQQKRDLARLEGNPPAVLVFRLEKRLINPNLDGRIDVSSMFESFTPTKDATYELVGFCQNHHQVHWTSVVKTKKRWTYCNDSSTQSVNEATSEFRYPADYVVYRKVQI